VKQVVLALCTALLAGCESGTLTNHSQSCTSTGLFDAETVTCNGTAGSVRGSVGFEFGGSDDEDELEGPYRLTAALSVEQGEASVYDSEDERISLGSLSADEPLNVNAVVEPSNGSVFYVDTGEGEVRGLRYQGRIELL